jgi:hypothetical protein
VIPYSEPERETGNPLIFVLTSPSKSALMLKHAAKYDAFAARAVERILEARFRPRRLAEQIADATRNQIRDAMRGHPIEQRALSSYETLRLGDRVLREPREEDARDQADDETDPG